MNVHLHLKWIFVECFQTAVFTTSKAERYSALQDKGVGLIIMYQSFPSLTIQATPGDLHVLTVRRLGFCTTFIEWRVGVLN